MRPGQKIAVTIAGAFAALSLLIFVSIFALLPNPSWFGNSLKSSSSDELPDTSRAKPANESRAVPAVADSRNLSTALIAPATSPTPLTAQKLAERRRLISERLIDRYIKEDRIQSAVCENLGNASAPFRTARELGQQVETAVLGESKRSAAMEAVMLPIEYTLKNEAVRDLVQSAKNAADRGDTGFVQKAQFYAQAARATASMLSSRDEFDAISGHAYRLYAISRAAAMKPEILQDPDTGDLCRGIERSVVDGLQRDVTFDQGRLMRLLERHGIDPSAINYDPNSSTQIRMVSDGGSLQIKIPWLEKIFNSNPP